MNIANATIIASIVSHNQATNGGGIAATFFFGSAMASISGTMVSDNGATSSGGGLYCEAGINITQSQFVDNSAASGGGIGGSGNITMQSSLVADNKADSFGGIRALYLQMNDSSVDHNTAKSVGGIFSNRVMISDSTISGNMAGSSAGGIYAGYGFITRSAITGDSTGGSRPAELTSVPALYPSTTRQSQGIQQVLTAVESGVVSSHCMAVRSLITVREAKAEGFGWKQVRA